jgi:DNA-binding beta-propeller fold protein YncE
MSRKYVERFVSHKRLMCLLLCSLMMMALAGCSAPVVKLDPVFFPPPPNEPRIQFLKSITSGSDVEKEESSFFAMIGLAGKDNIKFIAKPYGIAFEKGLLYVCDLQASTVIIIDLVKGKFDYLKGDASNGKLKKPANVAVDEAGTIYVADTARREILVYDAAGNFIKTYGKAIAKKPVDVGVYGDYVYILDLGENDIKVIDKKSGELVKSIGRAEDEKQEEGKFLSIPANFYIDKKGIIYVTNIGNGTVSKLDADGHFLGSFGKLGDAFGEFTRPKGVTVDAQGRIFVVDGGNQNVQIFSEAQRLLAFFGTPPLKRGALNLPTGIAVTTDNLDYFQKLAEPGFVIEEVIFVANQMGDSRISIYGLGHKVGAKPSGSETPK